MVVIVTCRIPDAKAAANRLARAAAAQLAGHFKKIVAVEWTFENEGSQNLAHCRIHSKTGYYRATGGGTSLGRSAQEALLKLEKQRRRRKEIRVSRRRRPGR